MERHEHLPNCKDVIPINAARMFKSPAPVLSTPAVSVLLESAGRSILEIGAGCLRNALHLQRRGFKVTVLEIKGIDDRFPVQYDLFKRLGGKVLFEMPEKRFDWALSTFVVETICSIQARKQVVERIRHSLNESGFCVFSVRGPSDLVTARAKGVPVSDGYLTPGRTFARSYSRDQFAKFLTTCGFDDLQFLHRKTVKAPELLHVIAKFH
jgi:hypothetical protein